MSCDVAPPQSPTLTSLQLRHSSFSNPSTALPTSQLILEPLRCFTYVIGTSPTSPGEPPMPLWWCLLYPWWFCNLQWLRPARLYERCKLALELKRLKIPGLKGSAVLSVACTLSVKDQFSGNCKAKYYLCISIIPTTGAAMKHFEDRSYINYSLLEHGITWRKFSQNMKS